MPTQSAVKDAPKKPARSKGDDGNARKFAQEVHRLEAQLKKREGELADANEECKERRAAVKDATQQLRAFIHDNTPPLFGESKK